MNVSAIHRSGPGLPSPRRSPRTSPRRFAAFALLTLLATVATACGSTDDGALDGEQADQATETAVPGLVKSGTLIFASTGNFAPLTFVGPSGDVEGYSIDLGQEIARRLGLKFDNQVVDQVAMLQGLSSGHFDLTGTGLWPSPERQETFLFTTPDGATGDILTVLKSRVNDFQGTAQLEGLRLGAVKGSLREAALIEGKDTMGYKSYSPYVGAAEAILDLRNGRIDAIFDDPLTAYYAVKKNPDLATAGDPTNERPFAMAMQKGNTGLQNAINGALKSMLDDGFVATSQMKWFGTTLGVPPDINAKPPYEKIAEPR